MLTLKVIFAVLGFWVVVMTALSFVRSRAWWVRISDFPRPQIAFVSSLLPGLLVLANLGSQEAAPWEWVLLILLAASVVVQVGQMLPYTPLWKHQVPPAPAGFDRKNRLRMVASNVCMQNRDIARWLATVRAEDPDVIVAVEVDEWWSGQLSVLEADYPHRILQPQSNTYGMAIYARLALHDTEIKRLVEPEVPSIFMVLELPSGQRVRCVALHPRPPRPDIAQDSKLRDAELAKAGEIIREYHSPVIVVGDLNDVAWSHTTHLFQRFARVLDPRIGRGLFATFHANYRFLRYPLDHVFHTHHFDLVELRRLAHVGSDHFPIVIEVALRLEPIPRPEVAPLEKDDRAHVRDAVQEARELQLEESPSERHRRKQADK